MRTTQRNVGTIALTAGCAALAALSAPAQTAGQMCRDQLDRFAETQNLSAEPPPMVVVPPAVGDRAVIEPTQPLPDRMPTAPPVRPDADSTPNGSTMDEAARRTQMEALITAGRAAARRGDEAQCLDSLDKARRLSEDGSRSPGGGRSN
jgi:hypothetical protein